MLKAIKERRAIRIFQHKSIEKAKIEEIKRAFLYAPSARNERRRQFVLVEDPQTIKKLAGMKAHSSHLKDAPLVIVVCSEDWQYWLEDCAIAAEHIWLEAVNQGLSSCWTQVKDSSTYTDQTSEDFVREVLNIPKNIRILCMMPIAYRAENKLSHSDSELKIETIHYNKW